jgi:hypothetical protein
MFSYYLLYINRIFILTMNVSERAKFEQVLMLSATNPASGKNFGISEIGSATFLAVPPTSIPAQPFIS